MARWVRIHKPRILRARGGSSESYDDFMRHLEYSPRTRR